MSKIPEITVRGETSEHPRTPDGRYFVVRGRLWRLSNPALDPVLRAELVRELMGARRRRDRARVDAAKRALGERGPVWWDDGAPDWYRHLVKNTPYAGWFASLVGPAQGRTSEDLRGIADIPASAGMARGHTPPITT